MRTIINKFLKTILIMLILTLVAFTTLILCINYVPSYTHYTLLTVIISAILILCYMIIIIVNILKLKNVRDSAELKSADILGSDVKEAYLFGQIGLLITDEKGTILWYNEYLDTNGFKLLDQNINLISRKLVDLYEEGDNDKAITLNYLNKVYSVKLIKAANLYIFKDITVFESLKESFIDESPIFGFIQIDNYSDLQVTMEESQFTSQISDARKLISEFASNYDMYLKMIKEDTFILLGNTVNYHRMYENKFSIVDNIRNAFNNKITLSIGISYGYPDFPKLAQSAAESLEVAMSRGGDQVAISPFGENMIYIGGKTESKNSFNKAKIRILAQSFLTTLKNASNVLVIGHTAADFDSIGACLGVQAICDAINVPCKIVYDYQNVEKKCRFAFSMTYSENEIREMTANYSDAIDLIGEKTLLVAVDVNTPERLLFTNFISANSDTKVAIIDHHRRGSTLFKNVVFNGIDSSASSACELVAEYISEMSVKVNLTKAISTFMLTGTMVDTDTFKNKTTHATFEAMAYLKRRGADNELADEFIKEDYEQFQLKIKLLNNAIIPFTGVMVTTDPDKDEILDRTILAIVSQSAMSISGFDASFTIGRISESEVGISARSNGKVNVEIIMNKMGGGGHFAASATVIETTDVDEVKNRLIDVLNEYLYSVRNDKNYKKTTTTTISMTSDSLKR